MNIIGERTAVLGLHWVNDIVSETGAFSNQYFAEVERTRVVANTRRLMSAARAAGAVVVYTRVAFQRGYADLVPNAPLYVATQHLGALIDGSPGSSITAELPPESEDLILVNNRVGGFANSSLDFTLRSFDVETVILTGVATNVVVDSTARQASDLGYHTVVVSDCTCAHSQASHDAALAGLAPLAEVVTSADVIAGLSERLERARASAP